MNHALLKVRYHSRKMLLTLDLNTMVEVLLDEYGAAFDLSFTPMTQSERAVAEDNTGIVTLVPTRFVLTEQYPDGQRLRREDLEQRIVHLGRK